VKKIWKLKYAFHGLHGPYAIEVGCMCGDGKPHYHPWGIVEPPTHVEDVNGKIYPFDARKNKLGRYDYTTTALKTAEREWP
jgi:hypothetical protein